MFTSFGLCTANGKRINSTALAAQLKKALEVHARQTDSGEIKGLRN